MNIWFLLWFVLSAALLFFFVWTLVILVKQKKAWKAFAEKRNLRYKEGSFTTSPTVSGTIDGYPVSLFTSEHETEHSRSTRKMTAIEINLISRLPVRAALASGGMVEIAQLMEGMDEFKPEYKGWKKKYVARSENLLVMTDYLSDERMQALLGLMKDENNWVILAFNEKISLLRIDTPLPLDDEKALSDLVDEMLGAALILELKPGESAHLKSKSLMSQTAFKPLPDKEVNSPDQGLSLELEEDEAESDILKKDSTVQEDGPLDSSKE